MIAFDALSSLREPFVSLIETIPDAIFNLNKAPRRKQRGINSASQSTGFQPTSPQVVGN